MNYDSLFYYLCAGYTYQSEFFQRDASVPCLDGAGSGTGSPDPERFRQNQPRGERGADLWRENGKKEAVECGKNEKM